MIRVVKKVEELVQEYKTSNPWDLCEKLNIIVLVVDLPCMVNGFYHRMKKRQIIYINKWISNIQMKVVCAHELGHAVLHDSNNACLGLEINAQLELEADVFKCALFRWGDFGNELRMFMVDEIIEFAGLLPNSYILDF